MSLDPGTPPTTHSPPRERAHYQRCHASPSMVLITVDGELDAANALSLSRYVETDLESVSRLIVDLRSLTFFGTQGFSILHRINVMCSRYAVDWVLVAGTEVDRLLRLCDPDSRLPVADTLDGAIVAATRPPRSQLRLVSTD